jgi:endonuclease/exonuclease/phosphatase family metal-dependent hydrolase
MRPVLPSTLHRRIAGSFIALVAAMGLSLHGCAAPLNYTNPDGPLYQGCDIPQVAAADGSDLRVVSFNIQFARHIEQAIDLLTSEPELADADVILLQEMDEAGSERIAKALGMCWVYYPAVVHPKADGNFGNAILSRLPLSDPRKVILPHVASLARTQRIATSARIDVAGRPVRVYSLHVATQVELTAEQRREQVAAVLADAAASGEAAIIGGDLNDSALASSFEAEGYTWLTRGIGRTCKLWSLDHVFTKGLVASGPCGKVADNRGASDHRPIWVSVAAPAAGMLEAVSIR